MQLDESANESRVHLGSVARIQFWEARVFEDSTLAETDTVKLAMNETRFTSTYSMMKKSVPRTDLSVQRERTRGTGTAVPYSACMTRYSLATRWAEGRSSP